MNFFQDLEEKNEILQEEVQQLLESLANETDYRSGIAEFKRSRGDINANGFHGMCNKVDLDLI